MGKAQLGKVIDPSALERSRGPRGRLTIVVPDAWLEQRAEVVVNVPRRLVCAWCQGGGCDRCGRSGAVLAPVRAARRAVRLALPGRSQGPVLIRLARPFEQSCIDQLHIEVRQGEKPSETVRRLGPGEPAAASLEGAPRASAWLVAVALVLALLAVLLALHW